MKQAAALISFLICMSGPLACGFKKTGALESRGATPSVKWLEVSVQYTDGSSLPSGSVLILTLVETSKADILKGFLGETIMEVAGPPPYAVSLGYKPGLIQDSREYALEAEIIHYDRLLYTTEEPVNPFDKDLSSPVKVLVTRVPRDSSS